MEPVSVEEADEYLRQLIEGELFGPALQAPESVPWE